MEYQTEQVAQFVDSDHIERCSKQLNRSVNAKIGGGEKKQAYD